MCGSVGIVAAGDNRRLGTIAGDTVRQSVHVQLQCSLLSRRLQLIAADFAAKKCCDYPESTAFTYMKDLSATANSSDGQPRAPA